MQSTASSTSPQSDLLKTMQQQSAQNMILPTNKKKKYSPQRSLQSKQAIQQQQQQQSQQNNQQFQINKTYNVVSIIKTTATPNQQQQQQIKQQHQQQQTITQSYANVVNRTIPPPQPPPQNATVICNASGNMIALNNCQLNTDMNTATTIFNLSHHHHQQQQQQQHLHCGVVGKNNNTIDVNNHLATGYINGTEVGIVSSSVNNVAVMSSSGGNTASIGGGGGGVIPITNNVTHGTGGGGASGGNIAGVNAMGITLGVKAGTNNYAALEKNIVGVNVACIDNRKYDFKNNKLLTNNNNYQTTQEYVSSSGTNSSNNVRGNHQVASGLFRGPPASSQAPRNGGRHVPMQMYQQTIPQGVVLPFSQFPPRQTTYPGPQFAFSQPMQPNFYPYQFYQTHQRGAVGINAGVGVGNAMSVQAGPNGPMSGPPGATQTQMSLPNGAVLTGGVPTGSGTVLGVAAAASAQQVSVVPQQMVGVVPTAAQQTQGRRRKHALEIIDPNTNKNILEDLDLSKNTSNTETEYMEQTSATVPPLLHNEISSSQDHGLAMSGNSLIVLSSDTRSNLSCNSDIHQMPQQRDINVGQTPVVSAMSDAPSVEIPPTSMPQKPRAKKILPIVSPKEDQNVNQSLEHAIPLRKRLELKRKTLNCKTPQSGNEVVSFQKRSEL